MAIRLTVRPPGGTEPTELTYDQQRVRIGRGDMCDLRLPHQAVSGVHAMILLDKDRYYLVDPGSTNGTLLGDEVLIVERRKLLRTGDVITIADFEIEFSSGVAITSHHSRDRTSSVARHLAQNLLAEDGEGLREPSLVVVTGPQTGERFALGPVGVEVTIGRGEDSSFVLDDGEASRRHLSLDVSAEGVTVRDLGGKNALLLNERPIEQARLRDRDELLVGATRLVFDEPVEAYLRELASLPDIEKSTPTVSPGADADQKTSPENANPSTADPDEASSDENHRSPQDFDLDAREGRSDGSTEPRESARNHDEIGPLDRALGPRANEVSREIGRGLGTSSGVEIAILLVGALVLAACVGALVWIFR